MKSIYTTKGEEIFVDDEDYPLLSRHTWDINNSGYARTSIDSKHVLMHKLICPAGKSRVTDHKSRNKLDNRKENLRKVTHAENNYNAVHSKGNRKYIGVYKHKAGNYFYGSFSHNNKSRHLPSGVDEIDAAKIRDYVCWRIRGEFAVLNFPDINYVNFEHPKKDIIEKFIYKILKGDD